MKNLKRLGALILTLTLTFALAVPAFAAVDDTGFSDVDADAWYAEAVMYCREHNLMAGTGNNQFAPESNLTRAQLATVLYRIEGTPTVTGTDDSKAAVKGESEIWDFSSLLEKNFAKAEKADAEMPLCVRFIFYDTPSKSFRRS